MITELKEAIVTALSAIPGIATAEEYAGQFEERTLSATIRLPALLVHFGDMDLKATEGTFSEFEVPQQITVFLVAKHARGANARAQSVDALLEVVLPIIRNNNFIVGATIPKLDKVVPNFMFESQSISMREIRFSQTMILGESEWDGTASPLVVSVNDGEFTVDETL